MDGAGVMPAARSGAPGLQVRLVELRRVRHQAQDVEDAGAEHDEVDDDEGNERGRHAGEGDGRHRLRGAQQAIDGVGLAADLGRDPAGQHGDEACWPHQHGETQQHGAVVKAAPPPQGQAP